MLAEAEVFSVQAAAHGVYSEGQGVHVQLQQNTDSTAPSCQGKDAKGTPDAEILCEELREEGVRCSDWRNAGKWCTSHQ